MATFELVWLTPVGFKQPIYPHENCRLCRGPLIEVCVDCKQTKSDTCIVISDTNSNSYYHEHCFNLLPRKSRGYATSNRKLDNSL